MHRTFTREHWNKLHTLLTNWKTNLHTIREQVGHLAKAQIDLMHQPVAWEIMKFFYVWCHCGVLYEKYKLKNSNANWFSFAVMIQRNLFLFFLNCYFYRIEKKTRDHQKHLQIFFTKRKKSLGKIIYGNSVNWWGGRKKRKQRWFLLKNWLEGGHFSVLRFLSLTRNLL